MQLDNISETALPISSSQHSRICFCFIPLLHALSHPDIRPWSVATHAYGASLVYYPERVKYKIGTIVYRYQHSRASFDMLTIREKCHSVNETCHLVVSF